MSENKFNSFMGEIWLKLCSIYEKGLAIFHRIPGDNGGLLKYVCISTVIFLVIITVVINDNVFRLIHTEWQINSQRKTMIYYSKEINNLDNKLKVLSNDRDSLERFARENFYFAKPGEDVYVIEDH